MHGMFQTTVQYKIFNLHIPNNFKSNITILENTYVKQPINVNKRLWSNFFGDALQTTNYMQFKKKPSIKLNTESHLYSLVYKMHVSKNEFVVFQKRDAYIIDLFISGYCIFRDQCQKPLIGCVLRFVVRLF